MPRELCHLDAAQDRMLGLLVVQANCRRGTDAMMPGVAAAKDRWIKILPERKLGCLLKLFRVARGKRMIRGANSDDRFPLREMCLNRCHHRARGSAAADADQQRIVVR